jgi:nitrate ABC transporter ATP-binding subunit
MTSQETAREANRADARFVNLEGIHQVFGSGAARYHALDDVNLQIARGEFVSLIGHSGCGKSTLLNIVAGLAAPTHGHVLVGGREVDGPGLDRAVVFQSHSLLPWLSVVDNVRVAVDGKHPGKPRAWRKEEAMRLVEMVHLGAHAHKKPSEISGGMKQRVGIARAFAADPDVLLLDEPFGALDALTRGGMQDELNRIWEGSRKTVIMITHDVDEAIFLSDRVLLMSNGPRATIAEDVKIDIPRPRTREGLLEDPAYAALRKKLVHYLISTGHARQAA